MNRVKPARSSSRVMSPLQAPQYARGLIEASLDPLVTISPEGKITDVNRATEEATGLARGDLVGTDFADYFTEPERAREGYREVLSKGLVRDYALTLRHVSGRTMDVLYNATVYRDEGGRLQGVFAAARDVTERRQAEALRAHLAAIIESSSDAIIGKRLDGVIESWNRGAERIYGYTAAETIGRYIGMLAPADRLHEVAELLERVRRGDEVAHCETVRVRKDGTLIDVSLTLSPIRDAAGSLTGLSTIARDITEHKRAERELRAASLYARGLIEASLDPLVTISPEGKITDVNGATEEATGLARGDLVGTDFADYFTEPERAREGYRQVLSQGLVRDYALTLRHVSGRTMDVLYNATVYRDEGGRLQGVFAAARDVTERRRMEEQLRQSQKLEAIGSLAGGVAHDFNNLLTAIIGSCDLLLDRMPEFDPLREEAQEIGTAARRAATLTRRLLTFSRKQVVQPKVLDLDGVVAGMDKMLRRLIGENIELAVFLGPVRGKVRADPGQLEQVIVNLVVNARDAMPRGGKIIIETADVELGGDAASRHLGVPPGHYVLLAVTDTGTGMDAVVQSHLFEPFFTTKEVGKGSGLGLSTVYGIVKQAGGDVSAYSEPGRGSVFKVCLPRADEATEPVGTVPATGPLARGKETVLLVEDEPQVRAVTVRVLRGAGYTVLEAADGEEALKIVAQDGSRSIDALVTDMVMPHMGGEELATRVRAERPGIKVLFVSGYTEHGAALEGRPDHGWAFLQKPFTPSTLAHEIRALLDAKGGGGAASG